MAGLDRAITRPAGSQHLVAQVQRVGERDAPHSRSSASRPASRPTPTGCVPVITAARTSEELAHHEEIIVTRNKDAPSLGLAQRAGGAAVGAGIGFALSGIALVAVQGPGPAIVGATLGALLGAALGPATITKPFLRPHKTAQSRR